MVFSKIKNKSIFMLHSSPSVSRCQSVESVRSAEVENQGLTVDMSAAMTRNTLKSPLSPPIKPYNVQQPNDSPVDVKICTPNRGESANFSEYIVNDVGKYNYYIRS